MKKNDNLFPKVWNIIFPFSGNILLSTVITSQHAQRIYIQQYIAERLALTITIPIILISIVCVLYWLFDKQQNTCQCGAIIMTDQSIRSWEFVSQILLAGNFVDFIDRTTLTRTCFNRWGIEPLIWARSERTHILST